MLTFTDESCAVCVFRTAEDCRNFGPAEPKVKELVQGSFSTEWVDMNLARQVRAVVSALEIVRGS